MIIHRKLNLFNLNVLLKYFFNFLSDARPFCGILHHDLDDSNIPLIPGVKMNIRIVLNTDNAAFLTLSENKLKYVFFLKKKKYI